MVLVGFFEAVFVTVAIGKHAQFVAIFNHQKFRIRQSFCVSVIAHFDLELDASVVRWSRRAFQFR